MNITFIGTGYVGLVSGVMMSYLGHNVTCLDTNHEKISSLKKGKIPIYEPGLEEYMHKSISNKTLSFTDEYNSKLAESDLIFICVGTPSMPTGEADLSYVLEACEKAAEFINSNAIIVIKSTVPPGTNKKAQAYLQKKNFSNIIASNPEFLREGCAVEDFLYGDRIIIGTNSDIATDFLKKAYLPLTEKGVHLVATDPTTAELIKYAANAFLATKIAFINEMSNLCEVAGANISELSYAVGLDKRIGKDFLKPGPGFGGSCFPKDILALSGIAKNFGTPCQIIDAVISTNSKRPAYMVNKLRRYLGGNLKDKNIAILGLAFKAGTDDIRSSPAIAIAKLLIEQGANICAFDPAAMENAKAFVPELEYAISAEDACYQADAVVIITEWPEFRQLNFSKIHNIMRTPIIADFRNILSKQQLIKFGFKYYSIGSKDDS